MSASIVDDNDNDEVFFNDIGNRFGKKEYWLRLVESGPAHMHANVFVPPNQPNTVLKEYKIERIDEAKAEANLLKRARGCMPEVFAVYHDKEFVYIHMEKLEHTVMSRIEKDGIQFVHDNKDKLETLWKQASVYDNGSMCRVDNMMVTSDGAIKYIDAEKAEWAPDWYEETDARRMMLTCFAKSALGAHLSHMAAKRNIDLMAMGKTYSECGTGFKLCSLKPKDFTRGFATAMMRWFEYYEPTHESMLLEVKDEAQRIMKEFEIDMPDRRMDVELETPYLSFSVGLMRKTDIYFDVFSFSS